jgi:sugar phosphate isomerase/epimerase
MTRREALAVGALAAGASVLPGKPLAGNVKQSVVAWCFMARGAKWSLDQLCEITKGLGVPSVEIVGATDFPTLAKHNLTCAIASTGLGFPVGFNNLRHRDNLIEKTKKTLDACAAAKVPSVIGFVGMKWNKVDDPKSGEISRDDAEKNCIAGLKLVAGHAEKAGVTLCVEHLNSRDGSDPMTGHPGYQGDDLDWVCSILRKVGSPRVKLLFDIYHVQIMHGDLIRRIDECKDLIGHIHTAGVPGRGELDETQEINYPAVMRKLVEIKYAGYVGQEFIPRRDPLAGLKQAVTLCDV